MIGLKNRNSKMFQANVVTDDHQDNGLVLELTDESLNSIPDTEHLGTSGATINRMLPVS